MEMKTHTIRMRYFYAINSGREVIFMYGYHSSYGFVGNVQGKWMCFVNENEYIEYLNGNGDEIDEVWKL